MTARLPVCSPGLWVAELPVFDGASSGRGDGDGTDGTDAVGGQGSMSATLLAFARTLRACGVPATPDRVQAALAALAHVDVLDRDAVHAVGRATLCAGPEDLARYDRAFAAFFAGERGTPMVRRPHVSVVRPAAAHGVPGSEGAGTADDAPPVAAVTASGLEVLRQRDVARLSAAERALLHRMLAALAPSGPTRLSSRRRPARRGALDPRRTVRASLRRGGEPFLRHRDRTRRPRRLVLLVDVSGSMAPYTDTLLRFAHAAARRRPGTEVFTIGTRLTRVSGEIRSRDPDTALAAVGAAVADWSGGTRLGELLKTFLDRWGQRGTARGAVVVLASDGWERGGAELLGEQMARLHRLAHRVVWVNPHVGKAGYAPLAAGMAAALPHVDAFVAGHSLGAYERLAALLSASSPPSPPSRPSPESPRRGFSASGFSTSEFPASTEAPGA